MLHFNAILRRTFIGASDIHNFSITDFLSDPPLPHLTQTWIDETDQLSEPEPGPGREKSTGKAPPG